MGIQNYIKETKGELKHVSWPTKEQTINFTSVVIGLSLLVGVLLGLFDSFFSFLLQSLILK
jgi:preprotein translocase subunit SecE